ncbi:META domain-containing protein [Mesoflavibacter profundi]|uniref:META domain-containing protein n=1 Tax=Mesoflavibacter profundi TaxID=2708110 RepID=UPI003517EF32
MKIYQTLLLLSILLITSCSTTKQASLYDTSWELEFISGTRIAFNGLYPNKKPRIQFNKDLQKAQGNNSCNGYSAEYTLKENSISFGQPDPTTMMFCGEGEQAFLKMMRQVNRYSFDNDGKLNLMLDNVTLLRFNKVE